MPEKTKKQQQICEFSNDTIFICDDITNGTVLITDRLKIPKTNLSMNLVGKELCHHHYNKLIVNENHRLANAVKKQQCAHPKHEVYIKNSKKGRPRKHTLVKIPQRLQPILNLPTGTLICNPCLIAMDHDEENKQSSDYQPPIQKIQNSNMNFKHHDYVLRNNCLYSAKEFEKLEIAYREICKEFDQVKLSM